jgi:transposase
MLRADLERMLKNERHARFGTKSEKLNADQTHLPFEDIDVVQGMLEAASEEAEKVTRKGACKPKDHQSTKGNLPDHLPRIETVIEPDSTLCPCGCGEMVKVGEDRTDRLDIIPAQFRVLVTVRSRCICWKCDGKSHAQAPAPEYLVPRGLPTEALVAQTMVAKFGDYLLFYQQSDIYRRQGVELDRTVLGNWSGRAALMLMPIIDAMIGELQRSDRLFCPSW